MFICLYDSKKCLHMLKVVCNVFFFFFFFCFGNEKKSLEFFYFNFTYCIYLLDMVKIAGVCDLSL